jgi:hypothetical protein
MTDIETEHLVLDDMHVWVFTYELRGVRLGCIEDEPDWPVRLGPEPLWYAAELAELIRLREADEREAGGRDV